MDKKCVRLRTPQIHGVRKLDNKYPLIYKNGASGEKRVMRARAEYVRRQLTIMDDYYKCQASK